METSNGLAALLTELEPRIRGASLVDLPGVRAALARLDTVATIRVTEAAAGPAAPAEGPDRLLTAEELAARLGKSVWWVYRQVRKPDALPFRKDLPGGRYGFSARGLERWLARQNGYNANTAKP